MTQTFLVTGGTGRIGTAFIHQIVARGHSVRLCTREPSGERARSRAAFGPGAVHPIAIDVRDDSSLERAFEGVTGALLVAPFQDMSAWHSAIGVAAKRAGVEHVVKVSVTGARDSSADPPPGRIPRAHFEGEQALVASGVCTTMIRPTIFAQHFLGLSPALFRPGDDRFHLPIGRSAVAFVDCRDVGICAADILVQPALRRAWAGKAFELTGPTAVDGPQLAAILSMAGDRPITWVDGAAAFSDHAAEVGVSDAVRSVYDEAAQGWFAEVRDREFVAITGRHPTSFAKFAYDHRAYFDDRC